MASSDDLINDSRIEPNETIATSSLSFNYKGHINKNAWFEF